MIKNNVDMNGSIPKISKLMTSKLMYCKVMQDDALFGEVEQGKER